MRRVMIAYGLVSSCLFGWLTAYFEVGRAFALTLLFISPITIASRMERQKVAPRWNELCYLGIVMIIAVSGSIYLVNSWFAQGLDKDILFDRRFTAFRDSILKAPQYKDVELSYTHEKGLIVYVKGKVAGEDEYERLFNSLKLIGPHIPSAYYDSLDFPGRKSEYGYIRR